jgi:hypothetical protein
VFVESVSVSGFLAFVSCHVVVHLLNLSGSFRCLSPVALPSSHVGLRRVGVRGASI